MILHALTTFCLDVATYCLSAEIHEVYHLQFADPAIFKGNGRRFFVAEAKGSPTKGAGGNPVTAFVKCVPQVVGQCLAM